MARVTVEDCAQIVPSRFELVALAAQRAKVIASGGEIAVERDNDKDAVVALREIADQKVDIEVLRELMIQSCQTKVNVDQYGVEQATPGANDGMSQEVADELAAMQQAPAIAGDDDDMLYGADNISDVED